MRKRSLTIAGICPAALDSYDPDQVAWVVGGTGFSAVRLAINLQSADDGPTLQRHKRYIDAMGGRGIICFFEPSSSPNTSSQRVGRVTDVAALARMWRKVHGVFGAYGEHVMYEIFNEPWGYSADAASYLADMRAVIALAGLPSERVVLAGLYGSADVRSVAAAGWQGSLAYHVYGFYQSEEGRFETPAVGLRGGGAPRRHGRTRLGNWCVWTPGGVWGPVSSRCSVSSVSTRPPPNQPEGQRTRSEFSNRIQQDLSGLGSRVYISGAGRVA